MLHRNFWNLFRNANRNVSILAARNYKTKEFSLESDFFRDHPIDEKTANEIKECNAARKNKANIDLTKNLLNQYENESDLCKRDEIKKQLIHEYRKFPNDTHPSVLAYEDTTKKQELGTYNKKQVFSEFKVKDFDEITLLLNAARTANLGNFTCSKSYYLMGVLPELESALIRYTTDYLFQLNFELLSVPDILPAKIIEGCGMPPVAENDQVYTLQPSDRCLSGTSEMALAGYFSGKTFKPSELPKKAMAVSRCFRREASSTHNEKGIYRVHNFTKVEMFSVSLPSESEEILEIFKDIQIKLFEDLGLHFKLYDMPITELGAPAYRKFDIEAWIPSRNTFGEVSSASNCTDYQAKRLNIYVQDENEKVYAHTINGTACAIPRMLMAILEQNQKKHSIQIPEALQPYMGRNEIFPSVASKGIPRLKLLKHVKT